MKKILKNLPWWIIGTVSFTVVTVLDLVWILTALFIKATRLVFSWLLAAFDLDCDTNDAYTELSLNVNQWINMSYKFMIDLMYPVEEDDEDDDEDENRHDPCEHCKKLEEEICKLKEENYRLYSGDFDEYDDSGDEI